MSRVHNVGLQVAFWKDIEPRSSPDGSHGAARLFPDTTASKQAWPALLAGASLRCVAESDLVVSSLPLPEPHLPGETLVYLHAALQTQPPSFPWLSTHVPTPQAPCGRSGRRACTSRQGWRGGSRLGGCGRTLSQSRTQRTGAAWQGSEHCRSTASASRVSRQIDSLEPQSLTEISDDCVMTPSVKL